MKNWVPFLTSMTNSSGNTSRQAFFPDIIPFITYLARRNINTGTLDLEWLPCIYIIT